MKSLSLAFQRGIAAVEFALVAPVFFLLMFGLLEFGAVFYTYNTMLNAAREGARSMAVQGLTSAQAQTVVQNYLFGSPLTYTITATDRCTETPKVQEIVVRVRVDATAAAMVNFLNVFTGRELNAAVTMRKELICT